ncbi:MAG: cobalamin B12-binding domain-containing protein [Pseudomonadota bacterium]
MTGNDGRQEFRSQNGPLVDRLAHSVITKVSSYPHQHRARRVEIACKVLYAAATDNASFESEQLLADLTALRIGRSDIVDRCIPCVASQLGEDWINDRLSFATVTAASARLFGLCKTLGEEWSNVRPALNSRRLLLTTAGRETHILGPAVLADQLRRRGHSVQLHSNGTEGSISQLVSKNNFDGVFISVSTWQALETASKAIRNLKQSGDRTLIVIGGAIVNEVAFDRSTTAADLTTNDIDVALDAVSGNDISLQVAE